MKIWLHYCKVVLIPSLLYNVRSIPNKFEIYLLSLQGCTVTDSCCKKYKFRKHVDFPKSIFYALKENLVRKEKFALPPYCQEVSKKQVLKDSVSFFVVSSIVETAGPLNVCTIKDFTAKLRISNRNHFMCWILILPEGKYCGIMYARIVWFVLYSSFQCQGNISLTKADVYVPRSANFFVIFDR